MFIAEAMIDLKDIQVSDRVISFKKGVRFAARDGLLYEQIRAGNIKIIAENKSIKNEDIKNYIEFEGNSVYDNFIGIKEKIVREDSRAYTTKNISAKTTANKAMINKKTSGGK